MLDLPLLKKKKKKTGFNLDAALELPSEERSGGNDESAALNEDGGAEDGAAIAGEDYDLDMDFSKKKKKKKNKKAIDDLLPEKGDDDNQEDRENGKCWSSSQSSE